MIRDFILWTRKGYKKTENWIRGMNDKEYNIRKMAAEYMEKRKKDNKILDK